MKTGVDIPLILPLENGVVKWLCWDWQLIGILQLAQATKATSWEPQALEEPLQTLQVLLQ